MEEGRWRKDVGGRTLKEGRWRKDVGGRTLEKGRCRKDIERWKLKEEGLVEEEKRGTKWKGERGRGRCKKWRIR